MSFDWLKNFQSEMKKPANYAEKTLAAYKLGMKAKGSIVGVHLLVDEQTCCQAAQTLDTTPIYHPDDAPHVPLAGCTHPQTCTCVYRPVMKYQVEDSDENA